MIEEIQNNKRIAKNTLILYFRMFFTMAIGLYTSRIILQTLGISDFGIYNVVGGIISTLIFFNSAMVGACQRFISFELGKNNPQKLRAVFSTSVSMHLILCFLILLIGETLGLWFINNQLNIPDERMVAANWVYQCSMLTFIFSLLSVPYNSCIVAHEKMSAFAYISILETILKLIIVFLLWISPIDKLITYVILLCIVQVFIRACYTLYCKKHFSECTYKFILDINLLKEMFSFAGWSMMGCLGYSIRDQSSNVLINIFFNTSINASRGIGLQVSSLINSFSSNFIMALNPQITKKYAQSDHIGCRNLVYAGSRFSLYLLSIIAIPFIINVDYILNLWLGIVPAYTSQFLVLSLLSSMIFASSNCITTALQATGNLRTFQIGIFILLTAEVPLTIALLKLGFPPYSVMYPTIVLYIVAVFFRFYLIKKYIPLYSFKIYFSEVLLRCFTIFSIAYFLCNYICSFFKTNFTNLILSILICMIINCTIIFIYGINKKEKNIIINKIKSKFAKHESITII